MPTAEKRIAQMTIKRQAEFKKIEDNLHGLTSQNSGIKNILQLKFTDLRDKLQKGELKAVDVLRAYQVKALEVNREINCVTEPVVEAEAMAKVLDSMTTKKGLFHGIPISLKENIQIKGYCFTGGVSCQLDNIAQADGSIIKVLKAEGAIPFMRTNVPQTLMAIECSNPIYGVTTNPHDHSRVPGGSSGGEAALIAAHGSLLGIGNDIGGSVRIPAAFCGISSLKPTVQRTLKGCWGPIAGQNIVLPTNGPMARDVDSVVLCTKALFTDTAFAEDRYLVPIPFRNEMYDGKERLTVGYCENDGHMTLAAACSRAVSVAKDALEAAGHKFVPFKPPKVGHAMALWADGCFGDDNTSMMSILEGDVIDQVMEKHYKFMKEYRVNKDKAMTEMGYNYEEGVRYCSRTVTSADWWKLDVEVSTYKEEFLQAWREANIDVLIYPSFAYPAFPIGMMTELFAGISYTAIWNLVNYPAGTVPVTRVTSDDVQKTMAVEEKGQYERFLKKATSGSEGLPVCVQCVGLPYQDELVLRLMKEVETNVKY